jgi:HK97 family phage portal protein
VSLENPAVPLSAIDEDDPLYDALTGGAGRSASGVRVTRGRALGLSAVWRGVNLIAGDVGRHAFRVYRYEGDGLVTDPRHQAALVMRKPNDYMTPFTFRQTLQSHALLDGNGYAYIVRDPITSIPLELLPLDPNRTWPVRVNGELWYVFETDEPIPGRRRKRGMVKITSTDMLHIKGLGFDGLQGYPVIRILRETIGGAVAARDYGTRYFRNNARPGIVIQCPTAMKPEAINNLRESWERLHTGIDNAHRTAILRDGCTLVTYDVSAKNAQLLENREFDAREIANVLGVPPHKLGDPSKTAYNSLESENNGYREDTLDSWFVAWEQECDSKLLTEEEKANESHCCRFDSRPLSRINATDRATFYNQGINGGWLNQDEARAFEKLNPLPGNKGKEYYRPVNLTPVGATVPAPATGPDTHPAPDLAAVAGDAPATAADAAASGGGVQDTALNGAQITSLLLIADGLALKKYPAPAAKAMVQASFPLMDPALIDQFVSGLANYQAPADATPAPNPQPADQNAARAAVREIARETVGRMVRRLATHAERLVKRPAELRAWLNTGAADEHLKPIAAALGPVSVALRAVGAACPDADPWAWGIITRFASEVRPAIGVASDLAASINAAVDPVIDSSLIGA